jgi:flagellar biosynthesis component FlhA
MYFDNDMSKLMQRYIGLQVTVQTHGYARVIGTLVSVHESCIRLLNAIRMHELDDSRWYGELERANQQEQSGIGDPETLIATHCIASISCDEDTVLLADIEPAEQDAVITNGEADQNDRPDDEDAPSIVETIELRIGLSLVRLATAELDDQFRSIRSLRKTVQEQLGFSIPKIRIRDSFDLDDNEYQLLLGGLEGASDTVRPGKLLAVRSGTSQVELKGEQVREPAFGCKAVWIDEENKNKAELAGYTVVPPWCVIMTHLVEVVRRHAPQLLNYQETKRILDQLGETSPALVNDHVSTPDAVMRMHTVFRGLLEAGVSIANVEPIAISVAANGTSEASADDLLLAVRHDILPAIRQSLADRDNLVSAVVLDDSLQDSLTDLSDAEGFARRSEFWERLAQSCREIGKRNGRLAIAVDDRNFAFVRSQIAPQGLECSVVTTSELATFPTVEFLQLQGDDDSANSEIPLGDETGQTTNETTRMLKPR